ncbi:uncharacterized protein LOC132272360 [Cornus florida]|uniref:uncharacterized protein LOC132272360 n=1 Tax=Cornus florida TaxID=4283 RepID=UPI00289FE49A|nr:uncharacterized protein LOC132272360 [Cornus florida]
MHNRESSSRASSLDLGASVNLLPYSVYLQLGLEELKPTSIIFQLANRSTKQPRGIIEDVIIKVDKLYFPVDFIVLDTELVPESMRHIPVILGRLFLATVNASINYRNDIMDLSFGNMKVRLNIFNASNCPSDDKDCFLVDTIDECVEKMSLFALTKDPLEACLSYFDTKSFDVNKSSEEVNVILDGANMHNIPLWKIPIEPLLPLSSEPPTLSLKYPPELELKSLPSHLKYAYLGQKTLFHCIIHSRISSYCNFRRRLHHGMMNWMGSRKKTVRPDRKDWYIEDSVPTEGVESVTLTDPIYST